jgi:hypothetical protein
MPLNWQVWDRIRAFARKANIYRTDNNYQDQDILDRIVSGGDFIDFSRQSALLEQTNLQINRLERYKDYDMMDEVGEVTLALDMYGDESSLVDPERKHSVLVKAKSTRIKMVVEDLLYNTLLSDRDIRPMIRYLCKYGDYPAEIVTTKNRDGVASLRFMNVYNFTRIQTKHGDLVGFFFQDPTTMQPLFLHPWQVMHLRLTSFETQYHPYGRAILDGGRKDFKRLRLMEDAALIYRLTRAPEKRIFSIPVGNIPSQQVPQYIELIARQMKKHKFVDPASGQVNERWNPLIQEDDFWLPKRADGTGPTIDTLPGAENLDQIADIEYFKKKMIAGLKIPFSRVGIGEPSEADGRSLASVSPEFAKAIQWIQREVIIGLKKVVIVHLALRGYSVDDIKSFDLHMTAASAIDELYRIETWNTRADIIGNLLETQLFPNEWILERFTDMTKDEIMQMEAKKRREKQTQPPATKEDIDEQEKMLMVEYNTLEKRIDNVRELDLQEVLQTPTVDWYVNSKELDSLQNNKGVLVSDSIAKEESDSVIKETRLLVTGGDDEVVDAATNSIDPQKVISEEVDKIIRTPTTITPNDKDEEVSADQT